MSRPSLPRQQQYEAFAQLEREGTNRVGRRTSQRRHRRRGLMTHSGDNLEIPAERLLLACRLDTIAAV